MFTLFSVGENSLVTEKQIRAMPPEKMYRT